MNLFFFHEPYKWTDSLKSIWHPNFRDGDASQWETENSLDKHFLLYSYNKTCYYFFTQLLLGAIKYDKKYSNVVFFMELVLTTYITTIKTELLLELWFVIPQHCYISALLSLLISYLFNIVTRYFKCTWMPFWNKKHAAKSMMYCVLL